MPSRLTMHCTPPLCRALGGPHLATMYMLLCPRCPEVAGFSLLSRLRSVLCAVSTWSLSRMSPLLILHRDSQSSPLLFCAVSWFRRTGRVRRRAVRDSVHHLFPSEWAFACRILSSMIIVTPRTNFPAPSSSCYFVRIGQDCGRRVTALLNCHLLTTGCLYTARHLVLNLCRN